MAECAQCGAELSGRWQRRCTECGTLLCWQCGRGFETLTERFCTDCGGDLSAPGTERELESGGTPGLFIAGAVVAVVAAIGITALLLTRGHDPEPTTGIVAEPPANTRTWTATTTGYVYPTTTVRVAGPEAVVQRYFDAINSHDYRVAWNIGGRNFDPDYDDFVRSFDTTANDTVTIIAVEGDQVHITLDALQSDGSHRYFAGYYVVADGILVRASIRVR
ncbi:hypothetical protein ACFVUS_03035 [Nocardia sp. NPDC058058]|uniref:hypothetical protein n=1 Tax=Nocardia sp. NPDC058058 TaxID=3346317 RepID=UPI0036D81882